MIQYSRNVYWDSTLSDVGTNEDGLVVNGLKTTTGAPTATADKFVAGALVQNIVSGLIYRNAGTSASPSWEDIQNGLTLPFADTDSTTTTSASFALTASAITSGVVYRGTGSGATLTTGGIFDAVMGAAITGFGFRAVTTGVYTGTVGILQITANSATTGTLGVLSGTGVTTGIIYKALATAATLTTGRYYSANDGALEVFGIGANGHIHTAQTTAPTIAVSQQNGITAAAITAGSSDVCGAITTTGTNNNGGTTVLQVTFHKTYTTAPKTITLQGLNASAVIAGTAPFVSAKTATTFDITIPASASSGATPSFSYLVIA